LACVIRIKILVFSWVLRDCCFPWEPSGYDHFRDEPRGWQLHFSTLQILAGFAFAVKRFSQCLCGSEQCRDCNVHGTAFQKIVLGRSA